MPKLQSHINNKFLKIYFPIQLYSGCMLKNMTTSPRNFRTRWSTGIVMFYDLVSIFLYETNRRFVYIIVASPQQYSFLCLSTRTPHSPEAITTSGRQVTSTFCTPRFRQVGRWHVLSTIEHVDASVTTNERGTYTARWGGGGCHNNSSANKVHRDAQSRERGWSAVLLCVTYLYQ